MIDADYILGQIIEAAVQNNDIVNFGKEVAEILLEHKLIDEAVYEILTGKWFQAITYKVNIEWKKSEIKERWIVYVRSKTYPLFGKFPVCNDSYMVYSLPFGRVGLYRNA